MPLYRQPITFVTTIENFDSIITRTEANDSDFVVMISSDGTPYKITKANLLVGLSNTPDGSSATETLPQSVIFASNFESLSDAKGHTISGSAVISTERKYFGNSSLHCDGSPSSYISVAGIGSDFSFTANADLTFDIFVNFSSLGSANYFLPFLELGNPDSGGLRVGWFNNSGGRIQLIVDGSVYYFNWAPSINNWYYFSLERNSGNITVKVDAIQIGITAFNTSAILASTMLIGGSNADSGQRMIGYFDNARLTKSYAGITAKPTQSF